jgi:hypothetical protein
VRHQLASLVVVAFLGAGCGATGPSPSAVGTGAPTISSTPTAVASAAAAASTDPFAGKPFALTVPASWMSFDLSSPAGQAAIDAFIQANPGFAASLRTFLDLPNVFVAVNPLLADDVVGFPFPSYGLSLDSLGQDVAAEFQVLPGLASPAAAQPTSLPGGAALHWDLSVTTKKAGGGTVASHESVYLFANAENAVLVEFGTPPGGVIPDEATIVQSFHFQP